MQSEIDPLDEARVRVAVRATLEELGIDLSTPEARIEAQRDFAFIRSWRQAAEGTRQFVIGGVLLSFVLGLLGLAWAGFHIAGTR